MYVVILYIYIYISTEPISLNLFTQKLEGLKLAAQSVLPKEGRSRPNDTAQPSDSPVGASPLGGEGLHPSTFGKGNQQVDYSCQLTSRQLSKDCYPPGKATRQTEASEAWRAVTWVGRSS